MSPELYLASTYLKVVARGEPSLVERLHELFGSRTEQLLASDYVYGDDIELIFTALHAQGLDSWLLHYGEQLDVASHGTLGFAVLSSPNLATAMEVLAEFFALRSSAYDCQFRQSGSHAEFVIQDRTNSTVIGQWLVETGFRVIQQLIESVMAHPLGEHASIHFAYPEPDYHRALSDFYGVTCLFNQAEHKICIPNSWCRIQSPLGDEANFKANLAKCRELKLNLAGGDQVKERVSLQFTNYFNDRFSAMGKRRELPSLSELAAMLNVSSRTLARKLAEQQTSYKTLLEQARSAQACYLLKNTHLSIADVAYNLAYQESANFVRAFKVWFNTTPAAWRRNSNKTNND